MSKSISLVVTVLGLDCLWHSGVGANQRHQLPTTNIFSGGSGNFSYTYCVSPNGNVVQMEAPQGVKHLITGHLSEGLGICDATGGGNVEYFDCGDGV